MFLGIDIGFIYIYIISNKGLITLKWIGRIPKHCIVGYSFTVYMPFSFTLLEYFKPLDVCEPFFPSVYYMDYNKHFGVLFVKIGPL